MKHSRRQQDPGPTPIAEAAFNCWKAKFHFQYRGRGQKRWYSQLRSEGARISAERRFSGTAPQREADALAHPSYKAIVGDIQLTETEKAFIATRMKAKELKFEAWRS